MSYFFFENLKNPSELLSILPGQTTPLTMTGKDSDYKRLDAELAYLYGTKSVVIPSVFEESTVHLVPGILNLINYLIIKQTQNETIQTLLFLDKSARLAAFLFRKSVIESNLLAQKKGHDLSYLKKIQLRFISPHLDSSLTPVALTALKKRYRQDDFNGRVLIVDEFINSGGAAIRASQLLLLGEYTPTHLTAISNFETLPRWYAAESVKGVADGKYINLNNRRLVRNLTPKKRALFMAAIKKYGWEQLSDILTADQLIDTEKRKSPPDIRILISEIPPAYNPDHVVRCLASDEGTLALRPRKASAHAASTYRQTLSFMIQEVYRRQLIGFRP